MRLRLMRSQRGMQLIEMLTAMFITSFIGMAMCEIAVTQNVVALKTNNKIEALVNARRFVPQFVRDVHMARSVTGGPTQCTITIPYFSDTTVPGFPLMPVTVPPNILWNTDTITYQIFPVLDSTPPGQFQLTRSSVKQGTTTVVASGIVGPVANGQVEDGTQSPAVFTYPVFGSVNATLEVVGVTSGRADLNSKSFAFTTSASARSNLQ